MNDSVCAQPSRRVALRWIAAIVVVGMCVAGSASATRADGSAPRAVVEKTGDAVIAVLKNGSLSMEQKRQKIEDIAAQHFDFETLSRLVLARNWKKLSDDQQREFVKEFRTHLSVTYGKNIEAYNDEKLVITGDREESHGDWTVKSIIDRKTVEDVKVDYRLRQKDGEWMMIDVIVEGVSLVANFRSQFQDIISRDGPDKLIAALRDKNAKGEAFKAEETKKN